MSLDSGLLFVATLYVALVLLTLLFYRTERRKKQDSQVGTAKYRLEWTVYAKLGRELKKGYKWRKISSRKKCIDTTLCRQIIKLLQTIETMSTWDTLQLDGRHNNGVRPLFDRSGSNCITKLHHSHYHICSICNGYALGYTQNALRLAFDNKAKTGPFFKSIILWG